MYGGVQSFRTPKCDYRDGMDADGDDQPVSRNWNETQGVEEEGRAGL